MSLYLGDIPIANDGSHRITGEIGDMGFAPLGIDESLNLRRYLNGQIISQMQFEAFTTKVKSAVALFPSLATTESNWQTEKALSKFGQVGKFVIDDENQTIRLPAVVNPQGLLGLTGIGGLVNESLPNITGNIELNLNERMDGCFEAGASTTTYNISATSGSGKTVKLNASRSSSTYQDNAPVQQEAIQYPYYIQVATGIEETLPAIREYKVNNSNFFGQSMYSDIAPDNASWLTSNGQYNSGAVYVDYYGWLVSHIGETITANGGKVVLSTGTITDYDFVVNQNDQTFRLPLLNGEEDLPGDTYESLTLPASGSTYTAPANGFYRFSVQLAANSYFAIFNNNTGAVEDLVAIEISTINQNYVATAYVKRGQTIRIQYSSSTPSLNSARFYYAVGNGTLYYYVGDTVQDASLINAGAVLSDVVDLKQTTLRTDQITNCITEIPQDIKLELNNGKLTLKAGSKVYIPNGFEEDGTTPKFDVVTTDSDLSITGRSISDFIYYNFSDGTLTIATSNESGITQPSGTAMWYDTANNIIRKVNNGTLDTSYNVSFPICKVNSDGTTYSSIDQVFNGFGYIGSTVFALPNVKGLIPDGRNADGSLKNIEKTLDKVCVFTSAAAFNNGVTALTLNSINNGSGYLVDYGTYTFSEAEPATMRWYRPSTNRFYIKRDGIWIIDPQIHIGKFSKTATHITTFNPKTAFHAVDRNDSSWLSGIGMPSDRYIDLTVLASGSAYTAPANGYVFVNANSTANGQRLYSDVAGIYGSGDVATGTTVLKILFPVRKGMEFRITYTTSAPNIFRFIYAEGETNV